MSGEIRLIEAPRRWELFVSELIEMNGLAEVLQPMHSKVATFCAGETVGRLGEEYLAAVAGGADAGSPMDVDADVPGVGHLRLACVEAYPDAGGARRQCLLGLCGTGHGVGRT